MAEEIKNIPSTAIIEKTMVNLLIRIETATGIQTNILITSTDKTSRKPANSTAPTHVNRRRASLLKYTNSSVMIKASVIYIV